MILNAEQMTREKIENNKQMGNANIKFGNKNLNKKFGIGELIWLKNYGDNWKAGIVTNLIGNAMLEASDDKTGTKHKLHFDQVKPRRLSSRRRMTAEINEEMEL
jgi:hypothetical protein